jgi:hypothetical protein
MKVTNSYSSFDNTTSGHHTETDINIARYFEVIFRGSSVKKGSKREREREQIQVMPSSFFLFVRWDFGYCGHYWPIVTAPDDR